MLQWPRLVGLLLLCTLTGSAKLCAESSIRLAAFEQDIRPILEEYCFGCHADGANEGSMSFDEVLAMNDREQANGRWYAVLKQLQAGLMPPADEARPSQTEIDKLIHWIKYEAFGIDADNPDPHHVTMRRLNQVEYRNTIRDLIGVDYDTSANFPADDTGHGFDNIGDVLSLSPLLLEKYVNAAEEIVSSVVPTASGIVRQTRLNGDQFQRLPSDSAAAIAGEGERGMRSAAAGTIELSYYEETVAKAKLVVENTGDYVLRLSMSANETYVDNQFDENRCEFSFSLDGETLVQDTFVRQGAREYRYDFDKALKAGEHELVVAVRPLSQSPQIRQLRLQIKSVDLIGPQDKAFYVKPEGYDRFFPRDVPLDTAGKKAYARELLAAFASRAFRRPVDEDSLERLVELAESVYSQEDSTFESGIAKSMTAILASPRFLYREESVTGDSADPYPYIDDFSLASRLSYFLWSSMPDAELSQLARSGTLREHFDSQVTRMLRDDKARALSENFVGQWLRSRALDAIQINAGAVLSREPNAIDPESDVRRGRFFALFRKGKNRSPEEDREFELQRQNFVDSFSGSSRFELTEEVRTAMRRETEMLFEYIVNNDRSLLELVDSDYTFLNETLWAHYQIRGIEPVLGEEMRQVHLPANSHRGGVLTQGTTLVVTSNPDRTSPVKRGLYILENLLGTPPAAPPPNIPALEDVAADPNKKLSLRETLAIHRSNALCSSCHNQMDPLGLSLENFNALGTYRTMELDQPIDAAGVLTSGEAFSTVDELKRILVTNRKTEIYRCITEKMMTYALGRAVEYSDVHTVDTIVDDLESKQGRASALIFGILHSNAFQRTRNPNQLVADN